MREQVEQVHESQGSDGTKAEWIWPDEDVGHDEAQSVEGEGIDVTESDTREHGARSRGEIEQRQGEMEKTQ